MQIFVPVKSNLNANKMTAETTKSPLFCVGRQKNKNRVGLLRGPAGAPAGGKGFALYNLKYYTHKGNTMKLNFSETMRPTDTHNQSSSEVKLSLDEYYAIIYIAVCTVNGASSLIAIMETSLLWEPSGGLPLYISRSHVFLFGLALSDFGLGLFVQPTSITFFIQHTNIQCT